MEFYFENSSTGLSSTDGCVQDIIRSFTSIPITSIVTPATSVIIDLVEHKNVTLRPKQSLIFNVTQDKNHFLIEDAKLGISVYGINTKDLLTELNREIAVLWQEYVKVSDEKLSADAIQLKTTLKATFEEV